jgi:putative glutamine amidotransferase
MVKLAMNAISKDNNKPRALIGLSHSSGMDSDWGGARISFLRLNAAYTNAVYLSGGTPLAIPMLSPRELYIKNPSLRDNLKRGQVLKASSLENGLNYGKSHDFPLIPLYRELAGEITESISGLILTGGRDLVTGKYLPPREKDIYSMDVARDAWETALFEAALSRGKAVFGICRGLQLMNKALGGTVTNIGGKETVKHQQGTNRSQVSHKVQVTPGSLIHKIMGKESFMVNSGHHQHAASPGKDFEVTGKAEDGVIEVMELKNHPFVMGVQWHPEGMINHDPFSMKLFSAFIEAAGAPLL